MEIFLQGDLFYKRWFWKVASKGLYPTIMSAIGFAYIGIPSDLQITVRRFLPSHIREHFLDIGSIHAWSLVFLAITVLCAIWGGLGRHATVYLVQNKYKKLSLEVDELKNEKDSRSINCYELFSNYLFSHFNKISLSCNERVSLYKLDLDKFSCIGRYSNNELFRGKPNRLYPKNQGCISKAWETGSIEDANSPDPINQWTEYAHYQKQYFKYTEDVLRNIRMKSRAFYGVRLKNTQNKAIAVLLFESLNQNGLPFAKIKKVIDLHEQKNIGALIESLEKHIPSLENANREGF